MNPNHVIKGPLITEKLDKAREKLRQYKQLTSLRAVLLVSHRRAQVTVLERTAEAWQEREARAGEQLALGAVPSFSEPSAHLDCTGRTEGRKDFG